MRLCRPQRSIPRQHLSLLPHFAAVNNRIFSILICFLKYATIALSLSLYLNLSPLKKTTILFLAFELDPFLFTRVLNHDFIYSGEEETALDMA